MRVLVGLILILLGTAAITMPHLTPLRDRLPTELQNGLQAWHWYAGGGVAIVLGLLALTGRRRRGRSLGDDEIRSLLERRGFTFTPFPDGGWRARGDWQGTALVLRWEHGYHAARFGRPWALVATIPGKAADPLPLAPTQATLVEQASDRFTVVLPEAGLRGGHRAIPDRLDTLIATRE